MEHDTEGRGCSLMSVLQQTHKGFNSVVKFTKKLLQNEWIVHRLGHVASQLRCAIGCTRRISVKSKVVIDYGAE